MAPEWFDIDAIPFEKMWADDEYVNGSDSIMRYG